MSQAASRRTGGLTAVCVIAIVAGVLGLLSGLQQLLNSLVGDKVQTAAAAMQSQINPGMQQAQQEMLEKTHAIEKQFAVYRWINFGAQFVLSWLMLIGAILALKLKPRGRRWLLAALVASLVAEPAKAVLTGAILKQTGPVLAESMQSVMKSSAPPGANQPPGFDQMMGGMSRAIVAMQWVVLVGMAALWCVFYLVGAWYLTRPAVQALFAPAAPNEPQWS